MLLPTFTFAGFVVVVFTASWLLRPRRRAWRLFLVGASVVFILDPLRTMPQGGGRPATLSALAVALVAAMVLGAAALLRAAFPPVAAPVAAPAAVGGGAGDATPPEPRPGDEPTAPEPRPPDGLVLWGAPAAVTVLVAATNLALVAAVPGRADERARCVALLLGLVAVNQAFALAVHRARSAAPGGPPRALLAAAVAVDLGVLAWFKQAGWFAATWANAADRIGLSPASLPAALVPLGLSFLVLQAISYVVDVARGDEQPVSLLDLTVHLTFFPHVLAGPVLRVRELVPQLAERADPRQVAAGEAFALIGRGLVKKVVVAGYLSTQITQPVLGAPGGSSRGEVLVAIVAYSVQLYADISGYTDIAVGVALLLGIRMPGNFDAPYTARSLADFWRRWHQTLTRWFRDYLYVPLGGNRLGPARTQVNIVATMLVAALWHGAAAPLLAFGAVHGTALVIERRLRARWARRAGGPLGLPAPLVAGLQAAATFTVVSLAWVLVGTRDLGGALAVLGQLVTGGSGDAGAGRVNLAVLALIVLSLAAQLVPRDRSRRLVEVLVAAPPVVQVVVGGAVLLLVVTLAPDPLEPFVYLRF